MEAECSQKLTEQRRRLCAEHDETIAELTRVRTVAATEIQSAEAEARERLAAVERYLRNCEIQRCDIQADSLQQLLKPQ